MAQPMDGKTIVITGAGAGIGLATARGLVRLGARLVLVERDPERGRAATAALAAEGRRPMLLLADLSSQAEIRRVAAEILAQTERIDVLVNNAGAWFEQRRLSIDGIEATFALNHLGYFLLTRLLLDRLKASAPARIVCVSSDGHAEATLDFDDLGSERGYSGRLAYCRSKLANILFTRALARRLAGSGVTVNCLHPGHILSAFHDQIASDLDAGARVERLRAMGYVDSEHGARTPVYLASALDVAQVNGCYFDACRAIAPAPQARDDEAAERLWRASCELVGLGPDLS